MEAEDLSRSHPPFPLGGEVAAMWRFGTDADVAVRDQAVRAGGGSRGELMVPLYSARWALVSPFSVRAGGVGATSREAKEAGREGEGG